MKFLTCFFILNLTYCQSIIAQDKKEDKRTILIPEKERLLYLLPDSSFTAYGLTISDLDSVDNYLQSCLSLQGGYPLSIYYRQYVGVVNKKERLILINAFCRRPEYFLTKFYFLKGGGRCYFQTKISVEDWKITDFSFNAPK